MGLVAQFKAPYPIFQVLDTKKHVLRGIDARKLVFQGRPTQKNGHFLLKKGLKMPKLGQNTVFWAWELGSRPPNPIMQVLDSEKTSSALYGS